ncbi:hypothetical protein RRG08_017586 [Elysia crispata]|uniref:Uncharacterized protein n=1 Tax=Elysia crispata TaxID=231223 RepID=A0AAE0YDK8_9GAST|nr:hypothetical protein RRG08_017586 [Elysia crispata]
MWHRLLHLALAVLDLKAHWSFSLNLQPVRLDPGLPVPPPPPIPQLGTSLYPSKNLHGFVSNSAGEARWPQTDRARLQRPASDVQTSWRDLNPVNTDPFTDPDRLAVSSCGGARLSDLRDSPSVSRHVDFCLEVLLELFKG